MDPIEQLQEELHHIANTLADQVDAGFSGVHSRLDTLNGRVYTGEVARAQQHADLEALKSRVTNLESGSPPASRWRDRTAGAGAAGLLAVAVEYLPQLLQRLFK